MQHTFSVAMLRARTSRDSVSAPPLLVEAIRKDGFRCIFRGIFVASSSYAIAETIYCNVYEKSIAACDATSSIVADVAQVVLTSPTDVLATRQMTAGYGMLSGVAYTSSYRTCIGLWRSSGIKPFFSGVFPMLMYCPSNALVVDNLQCAKAKTTTLFFVLLWTRESTRLHFDLCFLYHAPFCCDSCNEFGTTTASSERNAN